MRSEGVVQRQYRGNEGEVHGRGWGWGGWGAEGGRKDDRTHGAGDKRKGKKEKRERTMSAD